MNFLELIGLSRPRPAAAASVPAAALVLPATPTSDQRSDADIEEQRERIRNLVADTALKLQSIRAAKAQNTIAIVTVIATVGGVLIALGTLYENFHRDMKPSNTYIFLSPTPQTVL